MGDGRILRASRHGVYVIKLEGQVRLSLCAALDDFIVQMFGDAALRGVMIDVVAAESIDSTTLGLLARLSKQCVERLGGRPSLHGASKDVRRVLDSMGFDDVFDYTDADCAVCTTFENLDERSDSEDGMRRRVIDAHRELVALDERNRAAFTPLLSTLEPPPSR